LLKCSHDKPLKPPVRGGECFEQSFQASLDWLWRELSFVQRRLVVVSVPSAFGIYTRLITGAR
jgi:hypothetical protein